MQKKEMWSEVDSSQIIRDIVKRLRPGRIHIRNVANQTGSRSAKCCL